MKISRNEVIHLALICRLGIDDSEIEKFQHQLSNILENFQIINQIDTSSLPPTSHSISLSNIFRDDEPKNSLDINSVLMNAPSTEDNYFKIKAVLE